MKFCVILIGLGSLFILSLGKLRAEEPTGVAAIVPLLIQVDDADFQLDLLKGISAGLEGNRRVEMPKGWSEAAEKLAKSSKPEVQELSRRLSILFGDPATTSAVRQIIADKQASHDDRDRALGMLLAVRDERLPPILHELISVPDLARSALKGLASYDDPATPEKILAVYPKLTPEAKADALATLATRIVYAKKLLTGIENKTIARTDLSAVTMQQLQGLGDTQLDQQIELVWGVVRSSTGEKKQEIAKLKALLKTPPEVALDRSHGRALYVKTCLQCHTLFGEGGKVGPDITGANRADIDYLLLNIVDPSAILAKDYQMSIIHTTDGRSLSGIIQKQDETSLTFVMPTAVVVVPRKEIEAIKLSELSLMPEGLLTKLSEQELRDLMAYLQNSEQVPLPQ